MAITCIQCGEADLEPKTIQLPGTVRGEGFTVEMEGLECPRCGYKTIEGSKMPEYGRLLADKYRASHGLLTSDEIRQRRKRLGLTQEQFAAYLEVGIASVKRWEMGKIQDPRHNQLIIERTRPPDAAVWGWLEHFPAIVTSTSRAFGPKLGSDIFTIAHRSVVQSTFFVAEEDTVVHDYIESLLGARDLGIPPKQTGLGWELLCFESPRQTLLPRSWMVSK
jgi:putative zinc finger/helix-turn-helix YgiT family protein